MHEASRPVRVGTHFSRGSACCPSVTSLFSVTQETARVDYRLELPTQLVVRELAARERAQDHADPGGYVPEKLDELESGLVMRVDGKSVPMRRVPSDAPTAAATAAAHAPPPPASPPEPV